MLLALLGGSSGDAQHKRIKSCITLCDDTTVIRHFKKLCFQINLEEVLN